MVTDARPSDAGPKANASSVDGEPPRPPDAWQPLWRSLDELREYVAYYLAVQADRLRLQIRKAVMLTIAACAAAIAGMTLVVTSVVLLLCGAGAGLGELLGGRIWLGNLIVGAGLLAVTAGILTSFGYGILRASRTKTIEKYDSRRATQYRRFGHDVGGRN